MTSLGRGDLGVDPDGLLWTRAPGGQCVMTHACEYGRLPTGHLATRLVLLAVIEGAWRWTDCLIALPFAQPKELTRS
jgi:hypothetical protein